MNNTKYPPTDYSKAQDELKEKLCKELNNYEPKLTENIALKIALQLEVSFRTVQRYCSGNISDVRRIPLAQDILNELRKEIKI
jgi:hypothetical protein